MSPGSSREPAPVPEEHSRPAPVQFPSSQVAAALAEPPGSLASPFGCGEARFAVGWFSGLRGARSLRAGFSLLESFLLRPLQFCAGSEGKLGSVLSFLSATHWDASVLRYANKNLGF